MQVIVKLNKHFVNKFYKVFFVQNSSFFCFFLPEILIITTYATVMLANYFFSNIYFNFNFMNVISYSYYGLVLINFI